MANVIDLTAARNRMGAKGTPSHPILEALDTLGVALADHGHRWTDREVRLYETAVAYVLGQPQSD